MANHQVGNEPADASWIDKRRNARGDNTNHNATPLNYDSIANLRARLTAISGTTFTAARMDAMTVNDMYYAIRLNDDAAGV